MRLDFIPPHTTLLPCSYITPQTEMFIAIARLPAIHFPSISRVHACVFFFLQVKGTSSSWCSVFLANKAVWVLRNSRRALHRSSSVQYLPLSIIELLLSSYEKGTRGGRGESFFPADLFEQIYLIHIYETHICKDTVSNGI